MAYGGQLSCAISISADVQSICMYYVKALLRCIGIVIVMVAITVLLGGSRRVVPGTVALVYLTVILIVAALWQVRQGLFACATAALCFAYFLPPGHSFRITGVRHWILLIAFLITAITASFLSNRIQSEAAVANLRRKEMEWICDFSQRLLIEGNVGDLIRSIPRSLVVSFQLTSAIIYIADQDRIYSSENLDGAALNLSPQDLESLHAAMENPAGPTLDKHGMYVPLRAGLRTIGLLTLTGKLPAIETLETAASLVTMSITRATAMENIAYVEANRENEWMRNVLMNSATRELRLPVIEIESAAAGICSVMQHTTEERDAAVAHILSESARLRQLIDQAVTLAQNDPAEVRLQLRPSSMEDVIKQVLAVKAHTLQYNPVELDLMERSHSVLMDPGWIVQVLGYLLDNAAYYSPEGKPITIRSEIRGKKLFVNVIDRGIGIDPAEHALIFERFYRSVQQPGQSKGAGMGLPIARAIVEAHGGTLEVSSQLGLGAAFTFSLPLAADF